MATTQKNNHRSIRFTNEIAAIIEAQEGENFNQKLENLIHECYTALPEKQRQTEQLELQKQKLQIELDELRQRTRLIIDKHRLLEMNLNRYEHELNNAIERLTL